MAIVTEGLRAKINAWLVENKRECPQCHAAAESLEVISLDDDALHPSAAGPHGIDTSNTCTMAYLKCKQCDFDGLILPLEDVGLA